MRLLLALAYTSLALLLAQVQTCAADDASLKPFTTDGCSVWVDGTPKQPYLWRHCCVAHDRAYWKGGTEVERKLADTNLQACVADLGGNGMANYMFFFVTTGGSPLWLTPYRWGYGWDYLDKGKPRGYRVLTESEQAQVNVLLPQAEQTTSDDAARHPASFIFLGKK
jgi:hypothetical protein